MANDKHRNKKPEKQDSIKSFLRHLGIRRDKDEFDEKYWHELANAGIDFGEIKSLFGPFSQQRNDAFFINESIARKTISVDYQRIHRVIQSFQKLNGFPSNPQNICELGGGSGVISMWLARKWPESHITVIDHSQNPLAIGEKWSKDLGLSNLTFKRTTYQDASSNFISPKNDFVFGINSIDFKEINLDGHFFRSLKEINFANTLESQTRPIEEFVKGCKNVIEDKGLLYINPGDADELGLLALFEYLRRYNFGVDWDCTTVSDPGRCQGSCSRGFGDLHLFLRPNFPSIFSSSWEDLRALTLMGEWAGKTIALSPQNFETYFELLSDGTKIYDATFRLSNSLQKRLSVYLKAGMMGFFQMDQNFTRGGLIHSAAAVFDVLSQIRFSKNSGQLDVIEEYSAPVLVKIEEYKNALQKN